MKHQAVNPYLPEYEYVPDAEPRVFGDRVYIYGSHDRFGAPMFCMNDYVCWSATVDDLGDWRFEGTIYRKTQDPKNRLGLRLLFAPDVVQGADGRFYLFYALDFMGVMSVAVCDEPAGSYEFLAHVSWPDGTLYGRGAGDGFAFDPGVLVDDDGRVYLYSGFYTPVPAAATGGHKSAFEGGYMVELERDMHTICGEQKLLFPKEGPGSFVGHEFFEASSIRKYDGRYYFVYSSRLNHELCYAVSERPDGGFEFGGTLVSLGDVGLRGRTGEDHATNYLGNTHGGLLRLGNTFYIFYHRQTNRSSYARQACAERLVRREDGGFAQAEVTSCGLNGTSLAGTGVFGARIACNLWSKQGTGRVDGFGAAARLRDHPYFTQDGRDGDERARQYIANMRHGSVAGFKYFDLSALSHIDVVVRCRGAEKGGFVVAFDPEFAEVEAMIGFSGGEGWQRFGADVSAGRSRSALYFRYVGHGHADFLEFELS